MEVLTEFIHVFCPDVSITLYYLKAVSLKQLLLSGRQAEWTCGGQGKGWWAYIPLSALSSSWVIFWSGPAEDLLQHSTPQD